MSRPRRLATTVVVAGAVWLGSWVPTSSFVLHGYKWPNGSTVAMHLQLGSGSGALLDGMTSWNGVATNALATENAFIDLVKFSAVNNSTAPDASPNQFNNVTFNSTVYGDAFGDGVLATSQIWIRSADSRILEADVVLNTRYMWNSYRGALRSGLQDLQRVVLHEFGHVLGLDHPDQSGQNVAALMNSHVSNIDALQTDDINGLRALYGGGVTSNVSFPPRNETNDFYLQLENFYREVLRAAASANFVDAEGANVWLTEYIRYRVGLCSPQDAASRVFSQISNQGVFGVCALTPPGPIAFFPRNEGLDFMTQLENFYRDTLRRGTSPAFVNNEGRVVWITEYIRYRLNGCGHGDALTRVFQQILGQGIQPVCR